MNGISSLDLTEPITIQHFYLAALILTVGLEAIKGALPGNRPVVDAVVSFIIFALALILIFVDLLGLQWGFTSTTFYYLFVLATLTIAAAKTAITPLAQRRDVPVSQVVK